MRNLQATGNLYGKQITVKQISKVAAKKLFAQGIEVYLQSSNMHPFGVWQSVCPIKLDMDALKSKTEFWDKLKNVYKYPEFADKPAPTPFDMFNEIVNDYSFYNTDSERGRYVNFYMAI